MRGTIRRSTLVGVIPSGRPAVEVRTGAAHPYRQAKWRYRCSLPVYQNLSGDVTSARQTRQDLASVVKEPEELIPWSAMLGAARAAQQAVGSSQGGAPRAGYAGLGAPEGGVPPENRRGAMSEKTVVLVGTLDTKRTEYQYLRARLARAGVKTILVDVGTLDPPLARPAISRHDGAAAARAELEPLTPAHDRGRAVSAMASAAAIVARER